ncbi:ankyrin repeat domain-containing protein [Pacificoceanicola onchidii]|uniref:ankyrin repeat domain-containing protein n=1 Tax=Pacificoceanicola onchidii TaxID=2562685 RepID=UPI0010A345C9|nr:ankyrin repeat domain-containing protein [Pacificoceanicola onchidii]
MSDLSLDDLRFAAKRLHRAFIARDTWAVEQLKQYPPGKPAEALTRADFLHIIAREQGFASWPRLKSAAETLGLDRATAQQRLKIALYHGQTPQVDALLDRFPDLADGLFGLECALYRREAVEAALAKDPALATTQIGPRRPILHLAFSKWIHARPELEADMLAIARMLVDHGADVNDGYPFEPGSDHLLSALYGAIGHANNMVLGRWLLDHGANPNDNESLYHATELGHLDGLTLLLEAGADPAGTNALFRAMDFNDHAAVELLLRYGAKVDDYNAGPVGGELPTVIPAMHQVARRSCDAAMARLVIKAGAEPSARWNGVSAYEMAVVMGNAAVAQALREAGADTRVSPEAAPLVAAVEGRDGPFIDEARLPAAFQYLLNDMLHLPGRLPHMKALVARGLPYDRPDAHEQITPTHVAGWIGDPEALVWLLGLRPDMSFVNGYGGTLLGTIVHGSENNPGRESGDYIACLRLALEEGVALPRAQIRGAGRSDVSEFLSGWAEAHPGQVV